MQPPCEEWGVNTRRNRTRNFGSRFVKSTRVVREPDPSSPPPIKMAGIRATDSRTVGRSPVSPLVDSGDGAAIILKEIRSIEGKKPKKKFRLKEYIFFVIETYQLKYE